MAQAAVIDMPATHSAIGPRKPALEVHLLGQIDYQSCWTLMQRLVYETGGRRDGAATLLLCEHPPLLTVGRQGSRAHIRLSERELLSRRLDVRWVNRGGGCLIHAPGQLAVYPIVPLDRRGWTVGQYLARLEAALVATFDELRVPCTTQPGYRGVWSRQGQLATIGVAVKDWITYHGAFVNVAPPLPLLRGVDSDPWRHAPVSSLAAGRRQANLMPTVRARLLRHVVDALGFDRHHLHSGHPLLPWAQGVERGTAARVG